VICIPYGANSDDSIAPVDDRRLTLDPTATSVSPVAGTKAIELGDPAATTTLPPDPKEGSNAPEAA
jgi:hypothetical protein